VPIIFKGGFMAKASLRQPTNNEVVSLGDMLDGTDLVTLPPGRDLPLNEEEEQDEQSQAIERITAELGAAPNDAFLCIYEVSATAKEPDARLFKCSPTEWDGLLDRIVEEFGSGKYRILGFVPKDNGVGVKRFMNRIVILKESKSAIRAKNAPPEDKTNQTMVSLQQTMLAGFSAIVEGLKANQPKHEDESAWLRKLALYKELFASPPQQVAPDPMTSLDKMLDIKLKLDSLGGGNDSSSIMPTILSMAKPIIEGIAEQQKIQKNINSTQQANPAVSYGGNSDVATQHEEETISSIENTPETQMESLNMNLMFTAILKAAQNECDPETYANLILDQLPDDMLDQLVDDSQWWEKLCLALPQAKPHEKWFREVHAIMLDLLTPDEDSVNQSETEIKPADVKQA
jgi:hypothetical protein